MIDTVNSPLWESLQQESKAIEKSIPSLERKRTGSYYTDLRLTDVMMKELTSHLLYGEKPIWEYRFLEPCVGTGNFVFSYLKCIYRFGITTEEAKVLLDNIYVADIFEPALEKYKELLSAVAKEYWNIRLDNKYFEKHTGGALLIDVTAEPPEYIPVSDVFPKEVVRNGFDIIATNPPYKNLKAEWSHYKAEDSYQADKQRYSDVAAIVSKRFKYSKSGVLNLYKLFVEEMVDRYAAPDAFLSLLVPAAVLSDKTCEHLRTHLILNHNLISVKLIGENADYVDAKQSLAALLIQKGAKTEKIDICKDFARHPSEQVTVLIEDIINPDTGNAVIPLSESEYRTFKKLKSFPKLKDYAFIINARGELDLTSNKKHITTARTEYPLLRGRNLGYYCLQETADSDYVSEAFVKSSAKRDYVRQPRIACQQIANMSKERRVTFSYVPSGYVLGNSCNFIYVNDNEYGVDIFTMLGLLNTKIINWYFKLSSSNNHVNNYEIAAFPVPIKSPWLRKIAELVRKSHDCMTERAVELVERYARLAYGLDDEMPESLKKEHQLLLYYADVRHVIPDITVEEAENILLKEISVKEKLNQDDAFVCKVAEGITAKYQALYNGYILNHTTFKLSDLDLEMIRPVPQGGSWKDIPKETVEKSARLLRITQTGGRTTLYGRIDYQKPSYTITTYFNRPGNGTYVHPVHERVLSVREAARFQGFQDNYYFCGNKTQLLKQVGNAVPTILAYQLAKNIKEITGCTKSVDLFCGAGGMTAGFKAAGIHAVISNDIEQSACVTIKVNNPEIDVLCGDITTEDVKAKIVEAARQKGADIICGGPPCQGFSMAGLRLTDDPRNKLFLDFVDIVSRIKPKVIVFENVEGLLSFQNGRTYATIHNMFEEIGYSTEGRLLVASDYAVPQKRKRVIIICVRDDLRITPSQLYPEQITSNPAQQLTAWETIYDLESVPCGETAKYDKEPLSDIAQFFRGEITYYEYIQCHTAEDLKKTISQTQSGQLIINL